MSDLPTIPPATQVWVLQSYASGTTPLNLSTTFSHQILPTPHPGPCELLIKTIALSNDPAMRTWFAEERRERRGYMRELKVGEVMMCMGIGRVVEVGEGEGKLKVGDWGFWSIGLGGVFDCEGGGSVGGAVERRPTARAPAPDVSGRVGLLGVDGLRRVLHFEPGQTLVVSGAAGSVGNLVVQYAKKVMKAGKVIGIAGSEDNCEWLREKCGADVALNYKSPKFERELKEATSEYVDAFFDNTAGPMLDAVIPRMKYHGRIALSGCISSYDTNAGQQLRNWFDIITNRLTLEGFIAVEYMADPQLYAAFQRDVGGAIREGKVVVEEGRGETVVDARGERFTEVPGIWYGLFEGRNWGKLVSRVGDEGW